MFNNEIMKPFFDYQMKIVKTLIIQSRLDAPNNVNCKTVKIISIKLDKILACNHRIEEINLRCWRFRLTEAVEQIEKQQGIFARLIRNLHVTDFSQHGYTPHSHICLLVIFEFYQLYFVFISREHSRQYLGHHLCHYHPR